MRVVAGRFRGRELVAPPGRTTRPITDRAKETLFNILGSRLCTPGELPECHVLDVFAGSGSLGIEALSRGACRCTFVEHDRRALSTLKANLARLDLRALTAVRTDNAWTMRPPEPSGGLGLIFVDPPYRDADDPLRVADLLERLAAPLAADGVVVLRQETRSPPIPAAALRTLVQVDERDLRFMRFTIFGTRKHEGAAESMK